jgi:hypothetical protein
MVWYIPHVRKLFFTSCSIKSWYLEAVFWLNSRILVASVLSVPVGSPQDLFPSQLIAVDGAGRRFYTQLEWH